PAKKTPPGSRPSGAVGVRLLCLPPPAAAALSGLVAYAALGRRRRVTKAALYRPNGSRIIPPTGVAGPSPAAFARYRNGLSRRGPSPRAPPQQQLEHAPAPAFA